MEILRNFINVIGIADENEVAQCFDGEAMIYSEKDILFIPDNKAEAKNIVEIMIETKIKSSRTVKTSQNQIIILDGVKKFKIIYACKMNDHKANFITLDYPYNTFFEFPKENRLMYNVNVKIIDAYFELLEGRKIYSHIIYLVNFEKKHNTVPDNLLENRVIAESYNMDRITSNEKGAEVFQRGESRDNNQEGNRSSESIEKVSSTNSLMDIESEYL